jgi:hypothetical protein
MTTREIFMKNTSVFTTAAAAEAVLVWQLRPDESAAE